MGLTTETARTTPKSTEENMTEAEIRKEQREEDSFSAVNVLVWAYEAGEINYSQYRLLVKATVRAIEYGKLPQNERV